MPQERTWKTICKEAGIILDDAWRVPLETLRIWWGYWFLIALRRRERRALFAKNLDEKSVKVDVIEASISVLEIERAESLCRKYNIPMPALAEPEVIDGYQTSQRHWYFVEEKRGEVMALLRKARSERAQEIRSWLLALTGFIGAITGLAAVLTR